MDITTITENSSIVVVQVSTWSGTKKLTKEELGETGKQLPPDQLATLGNKRLISPDKISAITSVRKTIERYMKAISTKFLSGWLLSNDRAESVAVFLQGQKETFEGAVSAFLSDYESNAKTWLANFPEWENLMEIEPVESLAKKFSFSWQIVKVAPTGNEVLDKGLMEEAEALPGQIFNEIASEAKDIWEKVFKGRTEATNKTLGPVRRLVSKMTALAFLNPELGPLKNSLEIALNVPQTEKITGLQLQAIIGAILTVADPKLAEAHSLGVIAEAQNEEAQQEIIPAGESLMPPPAATAKSWEQIDWF